MAFEGEIHQAQTKILRELLFLPATSFTNLQKITGLESDHAKFHIKRLVQTGYVDKTTSGKYQLSIKGREYANKLDTDAGVIERQPKVSVMLVVEKEINGKKHYLIQQRLKHPYYGFCGAPTGKIRWGESIPAAASRELIEETGLKGIFEHRGVFHERVLHEKTHEIIEDKIFHLMFCDKSSGKLMEEYEGGRNSWQTMDYVMKNEKTYKSFELEMNMAINNVPFYELLHSYGDEF